MVPTKEGDSGIVDRGEIIVDHDDQPADGKTTSGAHALADTTGSESTDAYLQTHMARVRGDLSKQAERPSKPSTAESSPDAIETGGRIDIAAERMAEYLTVADEPRWVMVEIAGADADRTLFLPFLRAGSSGGSVDQKGQMLASMRESDGETADEMLSSEGAAWHDRAARAPEGSFSRRSAAPAIELLETKFEGSALVVALEARDAEALRQWLTGVSTDTAVRYVDVVPSGGGASGIPLDGLGEEKPSRGPRVAPGTEAWTAAKQDAEAEETRPISLAPKPLNAPESEAEAPGLHWAEANRPSTQPARSRNVAAAPGGRGFSSDLEGRPAIVRYLIRIRPEQTNTTVLTKTAATRPADAASLDVAVPSTTQP
jgi:hypothetical protein